MSLSPNHNERRLPVSMLVLHYTGMDSGEAARARLCDPDAHVSAHWLLHEDGRAECLVDEDRRAWHAGAGAWRGVTDINSASIGIEIVNGGHDYGLPPYPDTQIVALIKLCKDILKRHTISQINIIGHSDLAPERKEDPGEHFPWAGLAAAGIGLWPEELGDEDRILFEPGDRDRGIAIAQRGLAEIGYQLDVTARLDHRTQSVITAFQRRFRPTRLDGCLDIQTMNAIARLVQMQAKPMMPPADDPAT